LLKVQLLDIQSLWDMHEEPNFFGISQRKEELHTWPKAQSPGYHNGSHGKPSGTVLFVKNKTFIDNNFFHEKTYQHNSSKLNHKYSRVI